MPLTVSRTTRTILAFLASVALLQVGAVAQTSRNRVAPVPNPCPRSSAGGAVQTPPALFSSRGLLSVRFSYQTRTDAHNRQLFCFMTPAALENPTLHVRPGDHLIITVTNNTPRGMHPMALNRPNCGATTMDTSSVNIHYHGTNTSPTCGQDEVIKTLINSGQTFQYNVAFPRDEPSGLYWYHPHVHGLSDPTVLGGATGALVVEGIDRQQPSVTGLPRQLLVIRDQQQIQNLPEGPAACANGVPFHDITVNNVPIDSNQSAPNGPVTFTPAILKVKTAEKQFWRVSNSSADTILDLQLQYEGVPQTLLLVALDGVAVNSQDGSQPGTLIPTTHFRLPPAARVEFIVDTPSKNVRLAQFVTTSINTGADGDCDPNRPILNLVTRSGKDVGFNDLSHNDFSQSDLQQNDPPQEDQLKQNAQAENAAAGAPAGQRFAGLATAPVARTRLLYFAENESTEQYFMAVEGQPEAVFNPNAPPAITATQGTVEQWSVQNRSTENHEFHIHQTHFLVQSQNDFAVNGQLEAPAITGQYLDMVEVPAWDGNPEHAYPSVTLLIDFRGPDIGDFVFHCHILEHEDKGMMNIIRVVPARQAGKLTQPPGANPAASTKLPADNKPPSLSTGGGSK